jgi:hypothetical protein
MSTSYKGHTFTRTSVTTDGGNVYEIDGPYGKRATVRPFLTSIRACRSYVNKRLELARLYEMERTRNAPDRDFDYSAIYD